MKKYDTGAQIIMVPPKDIYPDPDHPNVRGEVRDTTDLQPSIKQFGILEPLQVTLRDGKLYLVNGYRRWTAARVVGLDLIPVMIFDISLDEVLDYQLATAIQQEHPDAVFKDDRIVAGRCWAAYHKIECGALRSEVATMMGVTPDVAGAYHCLFTDLPEVQKAVADQRLAITAYSLMKHANDELKQYVVAKKGNIPASFVRDTLKSWAMIKQRLDQAEPVEDEEGEPEPDRRPEPADKPDGKPAAYHLAQAAQHLAQVSKDDLDGNAHLLERVANLLDELLF
jgi:hypothetical protein